MQLKINVIEIQLIENYENISFKLWSGYTIGRAVHSKLEMCVSVRVLLAYQQIGLA